MNMHIATMRFLTDENVARAVVLFLRENGHDVKDVKDRLWRGTSDKALVQIAKKDRRILITHDKDFMYQTHVTVLLLRFFNQQPQNVIKYIGEFFESGQAKRLLSSQLVIISEFAIEFRR